MDMVTVHKIAAVLGAKAKEKFSPESDEYETLDELANAFVDCGYLHWHINGLPRTLALILPAFQKHTPKLRALMDEHFADDPRTQGEIREAVEIIRAVTDLITDLDKACVALEPWRLQFDAPAGEA